MRPAGLQRRLAALAVVAALPVGGCSLFREAAGPQEAARGFLEAWARGDPRRGRRADGRPGRRPGRAGRAARRRSPRPRAGSCSATSRPRATTGPPPDTPPSGRWLAWPGRGGTKARSRWCAPTTRGGCSGGRPTCIPTSRPGSASGWCGCCRSGPRSPTRPAGRCSAGSRSSSSGSSRAGSPTCRGWRPRSPPRWTSRPPTSSPTCGRRSRPRSSRWSRCGGPTTTG